VEDNAPIADPASAGTRSHQQVATGESETLHPARAPGYFDGCPTEKGLGANAKAPMDITGNVQLDIPAARADSEPIARAIKAMSLLRQAKGRASIR
jgi:hypothetical protein